MVFVDATNEKNASLKDLNPREIFVFIPLLVMIFWMGVYSKPFVSRMEPAVNQFVEQMKTYRTSMEARSGAVSDRATGSDEGEASH
jgi:NADH-quinone oxidoreductase subunit M